MERVILHVDCNKFYASVECAQNPHLRYVPLAVGGDAEKRHGIVLTRNEIAASFGVKSAETLYQAKKKCPQLVVVPPNFPLYLQYSNRVREILSEYTDLVEPFGLDECWLDITHNYVHRDGFRTAEEIRRRIKKELDITVSIGISFNKIFAKLGSDYKKPDAVTVFSRENFREKAWPLPAGDLLYVGASTEKRLHTVGIRTIGDIAQTPVPLLRAHLGKMGEVLHDFANGLDTSPVTPDDGSHTIQSISNGTTTPRDLLNETDVNIILMILSESVARRMREQGFKCRTVGIGIRDSFLHSCTRQYTFCTPTSGSAEIFSCVSSLFRSNYEWKQPVRALSVSASQFSSANLHEQLDLFRDPRKQEKLCRLDKTLDTLKNRYGSACVRPAALLRDRDLAMLDPYDDHLIHPVGFFGG